MGESRTLTEKIISAHLSAVTEEELELRVDQVLLEDATGTMACLQFEQLGLDRVAVPLAVSYVDHNVLQFDDRNPDDHAYLRSFAARYGLLYSRPGNGISFQNGSRCKRENGNAMLLVRVTGTMLRQ